MKDQMLKNVGCGKYVTWISIAKAIGICLVVIGHSGAPEYVVKYIYSFHMPLFMLISGYLFAHSLENKKWNKV